MSGLAPDAPFSSESQINDGSNNVTFLLYLTQVMGKQVHLGLVFKGKISGGATEGIM